MNLKKIQEQINNILGVTTKLIKRKKTPEEEQKEIFTKIITQIEYTLERSYELSNTLGIDHSGYNELFYQIIDDLLILRYGNDVSDIIKSYVYDIKSKDKQMLKITDANGTKYTISNINELWNVVKLFNTDAKS
jgi:hypothetical protein